MKPIQSPYKSINCPQCGDTLPLFFVHTKIAQCPSCGSTIFLEDEASKVAGDSSVLAPELSLIKLGSLFGYKNKSYLPVGMIRYSYGRGFWEEWWLRDETDSEHWLSVDEGDMVLEKEIKATTTPQIFEGLKVGAFVDKEWIVTETGWGECVGFSGSLPKIITKGERHHYIHLSGKGAKLRTIELRTTQGQGEVVSSFEGVWIDPFDIKEVF